MPGLQRAMRSALLTLVLVFVLVTAWACVIAGFVWMLAGRVGAGPALPSVGGGVIALIVPPLSVAAMARAPDWTRPSAKALSGVLRGVMTVAGRLFLGRRRAALIADNAEGPDRWRMTGTRTHGRIGHVGNA